jgi:outer membrane biosynthesis protein TonB
MGNSRLAFVAFFLLAFVSVNCGLAQPVIDRVRSSDALARLTSAEEATPIRRTLPTLRPTFTPTPNFTNTPTATPTPTITPIPTDTPTPVPTNTPEPTNTPKPTDTPIPTNTKPPPTPAPPTDTPTPAPTPTPDYPFKVEEQGNREFQKTQNSILSNIILISDANGTPLGGYKLKAVHSTGIDYESAPSSWQMDALNGLEGYVKFGNLKFEPPGGFQDGTWTVWVVDSGGNQVSKKVPLSYSSNPSTWAWDFIWFSQ